LIATVCRRGDRRGGPGRSRRARPARVDLGEHVAIGRSKRARFLRDQLERDRRQAVLQREQVVRRLVADEVGPGGERLAELDRRRADRLERAA
jgi:hypothetical protein